MNTRDERGLPGAPSGAPLLSLPLSIFSVGRDRVLLRARQEAIARQSPLRIWSGTPEQASIWSESTDLHLWIFCFTVEVHELVFLAGRIRRLSPRSRLLLIEDSHAPGSEAVLFDRVVRTREGMDGLLDVLGRMATAP